MTDDRPPDTPDAPASDDRAVLDRERDELLERVIGVIDGPMIGLGFVWLALLVVELTRGLSPFFESLGTVIWVLFLVDFALQFVVAPHKGRYLQRNWLTALSLVLPAVRVFRIFRVFRAVRGLRLIKVVGSLNRGMRALSASMGRRGFGYAVALTGLVTLAGAAGMVAFEGGPGGLDGYADAVWWTAMLMTTLGSEYWPQTPEGRVLCVLLSLYAFAVFGYVTATLATYFVGRDAEDGAAEVAGAQAVEALTTEVRALRAEIRALTGRAEGGSAPADEW